MYRKALIGYSGGGRLYGVGHTYEIDDACLVRVVRRLDDLRERTLDEKNERFVTRCLTIGATEDRAYDWSADDHARACT